MFCAGRRHLVTARAVTTYNHIEYLEATRMRTARSSDVSIRCHCRSTQIVQARATESWCHPIIEIDAISRIRIAARRRHRAEPAPALWICGELGTVRFKRGRGRVSCAARSAAEACADLADV